MAQWAEFTVNPAVSVNVTAGDTNPISTDEVGVRASEQSLSTAGPIGPAALGPSAVPRATFIDTALSPTVVDIGLPAAPQENFILKSFGVAFIAEPIDVFMSDI